MGKITLHRIMFSLFFPAILGSIFLNFISNDFDELSFHPRVAFGLLFIIHWAIQFAFETIPNADEEYSKYRFGGDIGLTIGINISFYSLPTLAEYTDVFDVTMFYLGLVIIGFSFVISEIIHISRISHVYHCGKFIVNGIVGVGGLLIFILCLRCEIISSSRIILWSTIFLTLIASLITLLTHKTKEEISAIRE